MNALCLLIDVAIEFKDRSVSIGSLPSGYLLRIFCDLLYQAASMNPCLINAMAPNNEVGYSLAPHPPDLNSIT